MILVTNPIPQAAQNNASASQIQKLLKYGEPISILRPFNLVMNAIHTMARIGVSSARPWNDCQSDDFVGAVAGAGEELMADEMRQELPQASAEFHRTLRRLRHHSTGVLRRMRSRNAGGICSSVFAAAIGSLSSHDFMEHSI